MATKTEFFFTDEQKGLIREAIANAERKTSGEIRVHIQNKSRGNVVKAAEKVFGKLNMHKTRLRNGVLIFLAIDSRVFAIYGDKGIYEKVAPDFWNEISERMEHLFKKGNFSGGLITGVSMIGDQLSKYFPCASDDRNELSNEISWK